MKFYLALRKCGVVAGDRVVGYIPNCPEAIEAMAATAAIGKCSGISGVNGDRIHPELFKRP